MGDQDSENGSSQTSWFQFLILSVVVAVMFFRAHNHRQIGSLGDDWIGMGVSSLLALVFFLDAREGTAQISFKTYKRSEDPITFWTIVVILFGVVATLFFGSLGDLLGLWNWHT